MILTIIACFNPQVIGRTLWESVPSVRMIMEILITQNFQFPPISNQLDGPSLITEKKFQEEERNYILNYVTLISKAQGDLTPVNNHPLISQLMKYDTTQPARQPPEQFFQRLRQLDQQCEFAKLLCYSREPDFLLEIMKRQGPEQAMQWLVPVLSHSEPDLIENLHIECLCELLFHSQSDESYSINRNYIPTTVLSVLILLK